MGDMDLELTASQEAALDMMPSQEPAADTFLPDCIQCLEPIDDEMDRWEIEGGWLHKSSCFGTRRWFDRFAQSQTSTYPSVVAFRDRETDLYNLMLADLTDTTALLAKSITQGPDAALRRGKIHRQVALLLIGRIHDMVEALCFLLLLSTHDGA